MVSYAQRMSAMLGSADVRSLEYESQVDLPLTMGRQNFVLMNENVKYSSSDAAHDLGRKALSERKQQAVDAFLARTRFRNNSAFEKLVSKGTPVPIVIKDADAKSSSRWNYRVVDSATSSILVREKSGMLRMHHEIDRNSLGRVGSSQKWAK